MHHLSDALKNAETKTAEEVLEVLWRCARQGWNGAGREQIETIAATLHDSVRLRDKRASP